MTAFHATLLREVILGLVGVQVGLLVWATVFLRSGKAKTATTRVNALFSLAVTMMMGTVAWQVRVNLLSGQRITVFTWFAMISLGVLVLSTVLLIRDFRRD